MHIRVITVAPLKGGPTQTQDSCPGCTFEEPAGAGGSWYVWVSAWDMFAPESCLKRPRSALMLGTCRQGPTPSTEGACPGRPLGIIGATLDARPVVVCPRSAFKPLACCPDGSAPLACSDPLACILYGRRCFPVMGCAALPFDSVCAACGGEGNSCMPACIAV